MSIEDKSSQPSTIVEATTFRDSVSTMDAKGSRKFLYPKKPKGKYYKYRTYVSWLLLAILFIVPFIKINGNPFFMFNVVKGEFFIFGFPFYTQDFYIMALGMVTTVVFIVLFTVIYGRIFCGWICPQTIFLEMVFRKIEYAIDGDRNKQMKLDRQEWDNEKIQKRFLKYSIYLIISFIIANLFLAYIIGIDNLKTYITEGPMENLDVLIPLFIFTLIFMFVFSWFREQACTLVCPYGRLQSVLIDKKTIMVSYDFVRGESTAGRSKWRKGENRSEVGKGDCIDCEQCIVVCPTGIDIRNGNNQLECVNCTACIDACDEVMEKVGLPKGLVRYASEENIRENKPFKFTARAAAYTAVLGLLTIVFISLLFLRTDVEVKLLRISGIKYKEDSTYIINPYKYTLINKTNDTLQLTFKMIEPKDAKIELKGINKVMLPAHEDIQGEISIFVPKNKIKNTKENIVIGIYDQKGEMIDDYKTNFEGPLKMSF